MVAPNGTNEFAIINKTIDATLVTCARDWVSATDVTTRLFCFPVVSATFVLSVKGPVNVVYAVVVAIGM